MKVLRSWMSNPDAPVIPPDTELVDVELGIFASQNGGFVSIIGEEPGEEDGLPDDMAKRFAEESESLFIE